MGKGKWKVKCKKCDRKVQFDVAKNVDCDKPNCCLKYNMAGDVLNFKEFKLSSKEPKYEQQFTSPEPVINVVNRDMTEEEWQAYLESGIPF